MMEEEQREENAITTTTNQITIYDHDKRSDEIGLTETQSPSTATPDLPANGIEMQTINNGDNENNNSGDNFKKEEDEEEQHKSHAEHFTEHLAEQLSEIGEQITAQINEEVNQIVEEIEEARILGVKGIIKAYFKKFEGRKEKRPPRLSISEILWSWIGAFIGIGLIATLHYHLLSQQHLALVVGSFGASAVLIFGAIKSPLAQPRNMIGGHVISAIIGVTIRWAVYDQSIAIASGFSVATAIAAMQLTNTLHPPGGATALIAVTTERMAWGGYLYVFMPILTGSLLMLAVALVVNNLCPTRVYPSFWW